MNKIALGARIPENIINDLRKYCQSKGIIISHFVTENLDDAKTARKYESGSKH
jgi:hypothetical protein